MITVRTTADSKTYNSKDALKMEGFTFDPETKTWSKEYESKEAFDKFETEKFRNPTYSRKGARENAAVKFEIETMTIDEAVEKAYEIAPNKEQYKNDEALIEHIYLIARNLLDGVAYNPDDDMIIPDLAERDPDVTDKIYWKTVQRVRLTK
jgi:hypothetical protein